DDLIASADGDAPPLAAGGESTVDLRLAQDSSPIGAKTRTTDLETAPTDVALLGRAANVNMSSLAVCDVDGDMHEDIVIGSPADDGPLELGGTGAVTVVWGGWPSGTTLDLAADQPNVASRFFGAESAAHLGTAVACVDLDGDGYDDIIAGAPGADNGRGRVY